MSEEMWDEQMKPALLSLIDRAWLTSGGIYSEDLPHSEATIKAACGVCYHFVDSDNPLANPNPEIEMTISEACVLVGFYGARDYPEETWNDRWLPVWKSLARLMK